MLVVDIKPVAAEGDNCMLGWRKKIGLTPGTQGIAPPRWQFQIFPFTPSSSLIPISVGFVKLFVVVE